MYLFQKKLFFAWAETEITVLLVHRFQFHTMKILHMTKITFLHYTPSSRASLLPQTLFREPAVLFFSEHVTIPQNILDGRPLIDRVFDTAVYFTFHRRGFAFPGRGRGHRLVPLLPIRLVRDLVSVVAAFRGTVPVVIQQLEVIWYLLRRLRAARVAGEERRRGRFVALPGRPC